ncbi:MAG: hypothetical protein L0271_10490 [Gemmatimonadetes bacterium]|nr:hypothetical protein [Gemmatimonadota bacterium]
MSGIAERLAQVRRNVGVGVRGFAAELARRTGYQVSHTSVANYEADTTVPAVYTVAVARAFRVDLVWLLTGTGEPSAISAEARSTADRAGRSNSVMHGGNGDRTGDATRPATRPVTDLAETAAHGQLNGDGARATMPVG